MILNDEKETLFFRPKNIAELDDFLAQTKTEVMFFAGATDLMIHYSYRSSTACLVDLTSISEIFATIQIQKHGILLGAAVPMTDIISHPIIQQKFPILTEACRQIGSIQIQNRATLGGNIANASPAGDSLPVLDVLDAEIWIGPATNGKYETKRVDNIMFGPGQTCLKKNTYIAYIFLPFPEEKDQFWYFRKVGQRKVLAISKVSLAVLGWEKNGILKDIRISAGSVSPKIKRARRTEQLLSGKKMNENLLEKARQSLMEEINPITDIRSNMEYRKEICGKLIFEALSKKR